MDGKSDKDGYQLTLANIPQKMVVTPFAFIDATKPTKQILSPTSIHSVATEEYFACISS